ncbi:hypothetical protein P168DRAFT_295685 [Aspergillus campestris IBT 28561]|uniref:Uncharacterized protein n=1 Tax=Aspergillus campestris (strain IBT 28561) TaxID=1392248 RepID=A0A2I1D9Z1_ASPC2|nr:uncharacterized protein P168DRAFT_295685 [Aspergillus campestris IBT 28561]PKY06695.1 hypothetical protein P168DRAFT_295685 [Aspergillus campestris IBT 28561]
MFTRAVCARTAQAASHRACFKVGLRRFKIYHLRKSNDESLFTYTTGRFLYNERARLRERYVPFNTTALKQAISKHVGHGHVQSLTKLSEGGFNRVLLATMEDGFKAIVKIPYWISVPRTYVTTSEVATLTFLRSKGIPVPEVYGWSSSSTTDKPIGVEYIIMEHVPGYQKHALVTGIVDVEKRLFSIPFGAVGSIYFKKDVETRFQAPLYVPGTVDEDGDGDVYCIGPSADYMFWYGRRGGGRLIGGLDYLVATAEKEVKWVEKYSKPLEPDFPHNTVFPGVRQPQEYLELLRKYQSIAPYLLPRELGRPTLRHPDLTPSNVFICPDTFKVTSIIDWQHTFITPLVLAAGYPRLFENPDPEPPTGLIPPKYPPEYDDETRRKGPSRQWSGNMISLRGALMRICELWPHLSVPDECPIRFSEQEVREQAESERMWYDLNALVGHWRRELGGLSEEGWIPAENYDAAVQRNESLREEFSDGASPDELGKIRRGWPFRDLEDFY